MRGVNRWPRPLDIRACVQDECGQRLVVPAAANCSGRFAVFGGPTFRRAPLMKNSFTAPGIRHCTAQGWFGSGIVEGMDVGPLSAKPAGFDLILNAGSATASIGPDRSRQLSAPGRSKCATRPPPSARNAGRLRIGGARTWAVSAKQYLDWRHRLFSQPYEWDRLRSANRPIVTSSRGLFFS